ncbi:MAG: flagellar filament capping protein FliD [Myxococcota bacterium]
MSSFTFTGLASGLDTASIVNSLVDAERAPIRRLENKIEDLNSQKSAFNRIDGRLDTLGDTLSDLGSTTSLQSYTATSSNEDAVRAVGGVGAIAGRFSLNVSQLAESQRTYSDGVSARDAGGLFGTGTLTIGVGGSSFDVNVDADTTLEDIASAINGSGEDVSATIAFNGTDYRLLVSGTETGAANAVTFTESGVTLGLSTPSNTLQAAQDAQFTIDGLNYSSGTNVVNDALDGISFELQGVGSANVNVEVDADDIKDQIQSFVTDFNAVVFDINGEFNRSADGTTGVLFGDSTLRGLQSQFSSVVTSPISIGGTTRLISDIGLSLSRDGNLELDEAALDAAIIENPTAVRELFAGNGTDPGLSTLLGDTVDGFADFADGRLRTRVDGIDSEVASINDQIERLELRVTSFEEQLNQQFITLETTINSLNAQNSFLQSQLG